MSPNKQRIVFGQQGDFLKLYQEVMGFFVPILRAVDPGTMTLDWPRPGADIGQAVSMLNHRNNRRDTFKIHLRQPSTYQEKVLRLLWEMMRQNYLDSQELGDRVNYHAEVTPTGWYRLWYQTNSENAICVIAQPDLPSTPDLVIGVAAYVPGKKSQSYAFGHLKQALSLGWKLGWSVPPIRIELVEASTCAPELQLALEDERSLKLSTEQLHQLAGRCIYHKGPMVSFISRLQAAGLSADLAPPRSAYKYVPAWKMTWVENCLLLFPQQKNSRD